MGSERKAYLPWFKNTTYTDSVGDQTFFPSSTIRHALARKTFGKKLLEFELIQMRLGEAAATLYALESMVYMTAGIADNQTDVDISMESAACKRFAVRSVKIITDHCLSGWVTPTVVRFLR